MIPVVILAGGLATRLRPISKKIPKSLILFNNKPFIIYQMEILNKNKIKRVHLCLGYLGEMVRDVVVKSDFMKIMNITFSFDGDKKLGTGGAIKNALNYLTDNFFVMYGDSYLDIDFKKVLSFYYNNSNGNYGLMTVFENNKKYDDSNVIFKSNKIIKYSKLDLTKEMKYIDYGLGILSKDFFDFLKEKKCFDLSEIFEYLVRNSSLLGYEIQTRFYEIGSFTGIKDFEKYLKD